MKALREMKDHLKDSDTKGDFLSPWLNMGFYGGGDMGGNFEKYLIDKDGYVMKHFENTVLNYDVEKTLKETMIAKGATPHIRADRSTEMFNEEYAFICSEIEKALAGSASAINPNLATV